MYWLSGVISSFFLPFRNFPETDIEIIIPGFSIVNTQHSNQSRLGL